MTLSVIPPNIIPKLIMAKIGARPKGRLIEQHDMFFGVANHISDIIPLVDSVWQEVKGTWHLDAWREVTRVGDYAIAVVALTAFDAATPADGAPTDKVEKKLYFINLGGYLPNQFEEFHYKTLVVADSLAAATAQVKKSEFYKTYGFANTDPNISGQATSHVDDKHAIDVDDIHAVAELLPTGFRLKITPITALTEPNLPNDLNHIGYLSLKQLRTLKKDGVL